jgi:hypothetical protein
MHDLTRIGVAVVLVGDVDVGTGVHVVADLEVEMTDDVAAPTDHAAVADADDGIGDHPLSRDHAGGDAHVRPDQGVLPDADPALAEDGAGREREAGPRSEGAEPAGQVVAGAHRSLPTDRFPDGVHQAVGQPVTETWPPGSGGHDGMDRHHGSHGRRVARFAGRRRPAPGAVEDGCPTGRHVSAR